MKMRELAQQLGCTSNLLQRRWQSLDKQSGGQRGTSLKAIEDCIDIFSGGDVKSWARYAKSSSKRLKTFFADAIPDNFVDSMNRISQFYQFLLKSANPEFVRLSKQLLSAIAGPKLFTFEQLKGFGFDITRKRFTAAHKHGDPSNPIPKPQQPDSKKKLSVDKEKHILDFVTEHSKEAANRSIRKENTTIPVRYFEFSQRKIHDMFVADEQHGFQVSLSAFRKVVSRAKCFKYAKKETDKCTACEIGKCQLHRFIDLAEKTPCRTKLSSEKFSATLHHTVGFFASKYIPVKYSKSSVTENVSREVLLDGTTAKQREDIIKCLDDVEIFDFHLKTGQSQREFFKTEKDSLPSNSGHLLIVMDYKENISIGKGGSIEEGRNFYHRSFRGVLGIVAYFANPATHEVQEYRIAHISEILSKDSLFSKDCLRAVLEKGYWKGITHVSVWVDTGPHFRSQEFAQFVLVEVPAMLHVDTTLNLLVEGHGKCVVDSFFSNMTQFLNDIECRQDVCTSHDLISALEKRVSEIVPVDGKRMPIYHFEIYERDARTLTTIMRIPHLKSFYHLEAHRDSRHDDDEVDSEVVFKDDYHSDDEDEKDGSSDFQDVVSKSNSYPDVYASVLSDQRVSQQRVRIPIRIQAKVDTRSTKRASQLEQKEIERRMPDRLKQLQVRQQKLLIVSSTDTTINKQQGPHRMIIQQAQNHAQKRKRDLDDQNESFDDSDLDWHAPPRKRAKKASKISQRKRKQTESLMKPSPTPRKKQKVNTNPKMPARTKQNSHTLRQKTSQKKSRQSAYNPYSSPPVSRLENLGNTCYINSVLQMLRILCRIRPQFLTALETLLQDMNRKKKADSQTDRSACDAVSILIEILKGSHPDYSRLRNFTDWVKESFFEKLPDMQDPEQFLTQLVQFLCETIHDQFNVRTDILSSILYAFHNQTTTQFPCKHVHGSNLDPATLFFQVAIPVEEEEREVTLQEVIMTTNEKQELHPDKEPFKCPNCSRRFGTATQLRQLTDCPSVGLIQLKRFDSDLTKNEQSVHMAETFSLPTIQANQQCRIKAIVCHDGPSLNGGHVYCFAHLHDQIWEKQSDTIIEKVQFEEVMKQSSDQGYLLLFEKVSSSISLSPPHHDASPVVVVIDDPMEIESLTS